MSEWNINIELLIHKYANGTLSNSEAVYLADWVKFSKQNAARFRASLRAIEQSKPQPTPEALAFYKRIAKREQSNGSAPGGNALLLKSYKRVMALASMVAVVVVAVVLGIIFNKQSEESALVSTAESIDSATQARACTKVEYIAPKDATLQVTLVDGTSITLNQNTRLSLCDNYNATERSVVLDGEAYFDVAKSSKQFSVTAAGKRYIVHGTSFNILSFSEDNYAIVTLHSGKLEAKVDTNSYILDPGEELRVDENLKSVSKHMVDTSNSISWMQKELSFSRLPLKFVAAQISHKYGIKINTHCDIEDIPYTGQLRNEDLNTALHLLSITSPVPLVITRSENEYYISKRAN